MPRQSIAEKIRSIEPINSLDDLRRHLQLAIEIEHATLPPYLTAMYSLKDTGTGGRNFAAYNIILTVVMEEMLHLGLACNLLNAVGGQPRLAYPEFIPEYPHKLPQSETAFEVHIEACSDDALSTFQKIELPNYPLPFKETREVGYRTIGEFYENVIIGIKKLDHDMGSQNLFTGDPQRQLSEGYFGGRGNIFSVVDLATAIDAATLIIDQGEGATPPVPSTPAADRPHYYNFTDIRMGTIHGSDGRILPPDQQYDPSAVWPMIKDPRLAGSDVHDHSLVFNKKYSDLLRALELVFNGAPSDIYNAWTAMGAVRSELVTLLNTPIPNSPYMYGPTFEFAVG